MIIVEKQFKLQQMQRFSNVYASYFLKIVQSNGFSSKTHYIMDENRIDWTKGNA